MLLLAQVWWGAQSQRAAEGGSLWPHRAVPGRCQVSSPGSKPWLLPYLCSATPHASPQGTVGYIWIIYIHYIYSVLSVLSMLGSTLMTMLMNPKGHGGKRSPEVDSIQTLLRYILTTLLPKHLAYTVWKASGVLTVSMCAAAIVCCSDPSRNIHDMQMPGVSCHLLQERLLCIK